MTEEHYYTSKPWHSKIRKCHSLAVVLIHLLLDFYYNAIFNDPVTQYFPHRFATSIGLVKIIPSFFHLP